MRRIAWVVTVLASASALALVPGCGDDDSATSTPDSGTADTGGGGNDSGGNTAASVKGNVSYSGTATGPALYVALFPDPFTPGVTPPSYAKRIGNPTFPTPYEFTNV